MTASAAGAAPAAPARSPEHDNTVIPDAPEHLLAWAVFGERTVPGVWFENYWFRRHEAAYLALAPFARGARVLEAGCGEGYGAALLARTARSVTALDRDADAVEHVAATYPQIAVVRGEMDRLPFADGSLEVLSTFQAVEHVPDQAAYLAECARVLRPAGTLLLTTPNRLTFSPGYDPATGSPPNVYHTREYDPAELTALVDEAFVTTRLLGLRHGPKLRRWEKRHGAIIGAQLAAPWNHWPAHVADRVRDTVVEDFELLPDGPDAPLAASLDLAVVAYRRP